MKEARAEGWTKNPKYSSLPELMLRYRAAILLIRTHMPEVLNGLHTVEELDDIRVSSSMKQVSSSEDRVSKVKGALDSFLVDEVKIVDDKKAELLTLVEQYHVPQETITKWCNAAGVSRLDELDEEKQLHCIKYLHQKYINVSSV